MIPNLKLLSSITLNHHLTTNSATAYSSDDRIFILCDAGVYILTLKGAVTKPFSDINLHNNFFAVQSYQPATKVGIDVNSFINELPRVEFYENVLKVEVSSNLRHSVEVEHFSTFAEWSPRGIVGDEKCLLGVLTNLYGLEIYGEVVDENNGAQWHTVVNVTDQIIAYCSKNWCYADKLSPSLRSVEFSKRVNAVSCTGFTWSHVFEFENERCIVLFVGHLNDDISVCRLWEFNINENNPKFEVLYNISTGLKHITYLHWKKTKHAGGVLTFGNKDGKCSILNISNLKSRDLETIKVIPLLEKADNLQIDKITILEFDGHTVIVVIKQSYLIVFGINSDGQIFDKINFNVGNFYITGIHQHKNVLNVLLLTGTLKQLTFSIKSAKILIDLKVIPYKIELSKYRSHGLFASKNRIFYGILVYPIRLSNLLQGKQFITLSFFHDLNLDPLQKLMENDTGILRDHWDCIETIRLISIKENSFPWRSSLTAKINYDQLSLVQLKTLRLIAKISEENFSRVPKVTNYDIKSYVLLHFLVQIKLVVNRLSKLFRILKQGQKLSRFELQSIDVQNFFLKDMVMMDILVKGNVGLNFVKEVYSVMQVANELTYPQMPECLWCGERIIGPTCMSSHPDTRCCITMMPIVDLVAGFKCSFCKSLAHPELLKSHKIVFCPYCDVPMESRKPEILKVSCSDETGISDEDENNFSDVNFSDEFVIVSDLDEEEKREEDILKRLYLNMKKIYLKQGVRDVIDENI